MVIKQVALGPHCLFVFVVNSSSSGKPINTWDSNSSAQFLQFLIYFQFILLKEGARSVYIHDASRIIKNGNQALGFHHWGKGDILALNWNSSFTDIPINQIYRFSS